MIRSITYQRVVGTIERNPNATSDSDAWNAIHQYVVTWPVDELPGEWKDDQNKVIVQFKDNAFLRVLDWRFPIGFHGTRHYWWLMAAINKTISAIEQSYSQAIQQAS